MTDSPRWCGVCSAYGDHHTDRHYECNKCQDTGWQRCTSDPNCSNAEHGGYCGCLAGARLQIKEAG